MLSRIETRLKALDAAAKRSDPLAPIGAGARKATPNVLALQQAQARLEAQQGNLTGAANRLRNALAQVDTTTVQSVNAQRQLLTVEKQLETGTSALGGHFQSLQGSIGAVGGAIGGLPGQLLSVSTGIGAVTAAIGLGVSAAKSFGDAFAFKAELDATTNSIRLQLQGVRDSNQVFAQGQAFAARYGLTQQELTESIQASIGVMRTSNATTTDLLTTLSRLQVLAPEKPISEAARALRELQSGDTTSIKELFNIAARDANRMKAEIQGGADAVQVLSQFLDKTGIGMDTLAARTEGAKGKMIELAQAQEQLTLAQAEFAQGPGLALLEGKITVIRGATRLLSGDFTTMGQSIANTAVDFGVSSAAANAYFNAIATGQGVLAAQTAANQAAAQTTELLTGAMHNGGGGAFEFAQATNTLTGYLAAQSAAAEADRVAVQAHTDAVTAAAAAQATAAVSAQELTATQGALTQAAQTAANVILAGGGNIAATASRLAASSTQVDVLTAAYLRLAAAQAAATGVKLQNQTARQLIGADSDSASVRAEQKAAIRERRDAQVGAARDAAAAERNYQQTLGNTAPALARARAELAQLTKGSAAYINKQNDIAQLQQRADKAAKGKGGGAGGVKLTDQQKLNNSLLASQEQYEQKSETAERDHLDRIIDINTDFANRMRDAQESLAQSQLEGRAGFYDSLGSIEDAGLRQALAAQYEAAFQEADAIAREKGADVGEKFLEAKQAAIQAQGKRASEIAEATKNGDKDKAAYLAGVDKLYREAEERKLATIASGQDSIAAQRDQALADESTKYQEAQDKIGTSADQAATRKIAAAERAGQAIDAEKLKVDGLKTSYDALGVSGTRAGVTPTGTTTTTATATTVAPTASVDLATAIDGMRSALAAIERATRDAGKGVEGAVSRLSGKFAT